MEKNLLICFLVLWISTINCKKPFDEKLVKGDVFNINFQEYSNQDIENIFFILKSLFKLIQKKDLTPIMDFIAQEKGIYIDLKAHKTKEEVMKDLENKNSYLNLIYLDSKKLKEHTKDESQISLYELIDIYSTIKADFFIITPEDCEVKLTILENPSESYRFNNPYFIKINNHWYIYRLF
ncbi:MAG: hypothetical protein ACK4UJ_03100 [Leptonema sp. (in: bacteria)]